MKFDFPIVFGMFNYFGKLKQKKIEKKYVQNKGKSFKRAVKYLIV